MGTAQPAQINHCEEGIPLGEAGDLGQRCTLQSGSPCPTLGTEGLVFKYFLGDTLQWN